jgi:two-component system invasion response regulator UvrY
MPAHPSQSPSPGATSAASEAVTAVLIAMDRLTQSGYRAIEEADASIRIVAVSDSAAAADAAIEQHRPAVVLVDMTDDRMAAPNLIEALTTRQPTARVLAVAGREDIIQAEAALRAGAAGYICRSAPFDEILRAIHIVARGENYLDPGLAQRIALQKLMGRTSSLSSLSPREYEVFCMIASGASTREIARLMNLSYKTVANYGGSIKAKLKVDTVEELRAIARRAGVIG